MSETDAREALSRLDASIRQDEAHLQRIKAQLGPSVWQLYEEIDPSTEDDVFYGSVMEFAMGIQDPEAFSSELTEEQNELVSQLKSVIVKALTQNF